MTSSKANHLPKAQTPSHGGLGPQHRGVGGTGTRSPQQAAAAVCGCAALGLRTVWPGPDIVIALHVNLHLYFNSHMWLAAAVLDTTSSDAPYRLE